MLITILYIILGLYIVFYTITRIITIGVIAAAILYTKEKKSISDRVVLAILFVPILPELAMLFITYIFGE